MSATLTVRLPAETKEGLTILAEKTRRSNSFLAGEAIAAYVARELEIVNRIEAARANVRAGNFVSHETVIAEARALIDVLQKEAVKQRTVIWEPAARSDYYDILHFIAADNPVAALKVADRIEAAAEMLGEMAIGKAGRVFGTYEWLVTGLPYIIAYEILGLPSGSEAITILHVIHMSRDWPDGAWPET